jgi:chorismate-pyruvate lyase
VSIDAFCYPLDEFYRRAGLNLPLVECIPREGLPEPYQSLLAHEKDMTPTLEDFHGEAIHLEVLDSVCNQEEVLREVLLVLDASKKPVAFGAIRIRLPLFDAAARTRILEGRLPLGTILKLHGVGHFSRPRAFLKVAPDRVIDEALGPDTFGKLYGRQNLLVTPSGETLAEIVEILPPVATQADVADGYDQG